MRIRLLASATVMAGVMAGLGWGVSAAAEPLGTDASACQPGGGPAIEATIVGLKDRQGNVRLELYPATAEDYLASDKQLAAQGKTFRRVSIAAPAAGPVTICIRAPRAGRYALVMLHDRDGKMKFDYRVDGAGVASNKRIGFGKPSLASATVEVGAGALPVTIHAQYLGLFGFSPH